MNGVSNFIRVITGNSKPVHAIAATSDKTGLAVVEFKEVKCSKFPRWNLKYINGTSSHDLSSANYDFCDERVKTLFKRLLERGSVIQKAVTDVGRKVIETCNDLSYNHDANINANFGTRIGPPYVDVKAALDNEFNFIKSFEGFEKDKPVGENYLIAQENLVNRAEDHTVQQYGFLIEEGEKTKVTYQGIWKRDKYEPESHYKYHQDWASNRPHMECVVERTTESQQFPLSDFSEEI